MGEKKKKKKKDDGYVVVASDLYGSLRFNDGDFL
jgi:hypothetical protein